MSSLFRGWRRAFAVTASVLALGTAQLVATAGPATAATTTYYVDCSASTNGSGTQASPWNATSPVNAATFQAGDSILFKRGTTCSGSLAPQGSGSSSATITVDAYGTGARPVIAAGSTASAAFKLSDQSYWDIQNLEITGGVSYGVFVTGSTAGATLDHIHLTNLDVHGATATTSTRGDSGEVYVYPTGNQEVIDDVLIDGVTAHDSNVSEGIFVGGTCGAFSPCSTTFGAPGTIPIGQNITITNSSSYNIAADGILLTMAQNSSIEHSTAYNSGSCSSCTSTPSGLWEWYCQTCTLQYNEAYDNHTYNANDGGAFDIDNYNSNNTLQYNYGHDNDGYCLAVYDSGGYKDTNNIFRYNVCANNVRKAAARWGDVYITNNVQSMQIYNNTFYANPANSAQFLGVEGGISGYFRNNVVYSTNANLLKSSTPGFVDDNNVYYVTTGATPTFNLTGTSYSGLAAYQSGTGQEEHSVVADPLLNTPTYHGTGMSLTADTLQAGSPAYNLGVNVCQGNPSCSMGSTDYFGNPVTTGGVHNAGAFDAAAPHTPPNNTGFESGSCSSWHCYGGGSAVTGNARTGSYAVRLPQNIDAGAEQTITGLSPNTTYILRGFGKAGVSGQCVYLGAKQYDGTSNQVSTCLGSTTYTGGSVTFTTGASNTSAVVYFYSPSANSAAGYGDDLSLSATPAPHTYGSLQNTASTTCLDVPGATHTTGTQLDIWTCGWGANGRWTKGSNHSLQVYAPTALCLDVQNGATTSGSAVIINTCSGSTSQQWTFNSNGTITGTASGLCLGPAGGGTANGTKTQIQTCSGAGSQKWTMV
ncbi:ricin-type beta-trefoil lectin domain protein [Streptomyces sp. NPDC096311]|uniref:ricin-type beta-trefoil lectin domain protein n=1 Tax=Streptomyces sp. NPDC096311 TaxID=3366083 RepID=UPI003801EE35